MFPVYGLAEASLAVTFPEVGAPMRALTLNRHRLNVGTPVEPAAKGDKDAVELISEGKVIPYCQVRLTDDDDQPLPEDRIGHVQMRGDNVTRGYFENPEANSAAFTRDGWIRTGDLGVFHSGELYITGRAKEVIFVNGQNYYPHDLEAIAQRVEGLELGKVVAAGVRPRDSQTEQLTVFVLHRSGMEEFLPIANQVVRVINEQTGLEVGAVVPVKRIPKTTSGKIQRHLLEESYLDGEFDTELNELAALRAAQQGGGSSTETGSLSAIEDKLKTICDTALEGKRVGVNDNLFEIGASSLKLIEIHERIDHDYPGLIDLTELFDFPTIAELARHLQSKLGAQA
jgi:acyl-CoA synthetase (AMP-forming)/AMP-acid ligase II/acyl carrier protein